MQGSRLPGTALSKKHSGTCTAIVLGILSGFIALGPIAACADGLPQSDAPAAPPELPTVAAEPRDPRLPPLYPGESVSRGNGKRMKVWTTVGPVESQLTRPQASTVPNSTSVILDARSATGGVVGRTQNSVANPSAATSSNGQTDSRSNGNVAQVPNVPAVGQTGLDYRGLHGDGHINTHTGATGASHGTDDSLGDVPEDPAAVGR